MSIITILPTTRPKPGEVKELAPGHTASQWQSHIGTHQSGAPAGFSI